MRCAVLAWLSSNLLNKEGNLFGILKYVCDIFVKKFTFVISSPDQFLLPLESLQSLPLNCTLRIKKRLTQIFGNVRCPNLSDIVQ